MEETGGSKVPNLPASEERAAPRRMWDEVRFSLQVVQWTFFFKKNLNLPAWEERAAPCRMRDDIRF
jgi:hypothetical protein